MDVVVDVRDQALDLRRRHPVGKQVGGEPHLRRLHLAQPLERGLVGQPIDVLDQARLGAGQRVVQVEHAAEAAGAVDDRHVAQPEPAHEADRLVQRLIGDDRGDRVGHQVRDRTRPDLPPGDAPGDILLREDAGDPTVAGQDHGRRGPRRGHARDRLQRGQITRHHHRRRLHVLAHAPQERCGLRMRHA